LAEPSGSFAHGAFLEFFAFPERKIKELEHVPAESAPTAAMVAFFCHIPLPFYWFVLINMR